MGNSILVNNSQSLFIASMPNISVYLLFTRAYAQTHVFNLSVYKGSQRALLNATHEHDYKIYTA